MEDRFIRHGDTMTHVYLITDPYYFTEPIIKTNGFRLNPAAQMAPYPCETVIEVVRAKGVVPHKLPGDKHFLMDFAEKFKIPYAASRGGAETALPEYQKVMAATPAPAARPAR